MFPDPFAGIKRCAGTVLCGAGAVLFATVSVRCLVSGRASGLGRYGAILDRGYTLADAPTQFWLLVLLYAGTSVLSAWLAWRAWQG